MEIAKMADIKIEDLLQLNPENSSGMVGLITGLTQDELLGISGGTKKHCGGYGHGCYGGGGDDDGGDDDDGGYNCYGGHKNYGDDDD
jgi:hypothetical protein